MTNSIDNAFRECFVVSSLYDYQIQKAHIESTPDLPVEIFNNEIIPWVDSLSTLSMMSLVCRSFKTKMDECKSSCEAMSSSINKTKEFIVKRFFVSIGVIYALNGYDCTDLHFEFEIKDQKILLTFEQYKFLMINTPDWTDWANKPILTYNEEKTMFMLKKITPLKVYHLTSLDKLVFNFVVSRLNSSLRIKIDKCIKNPTLLKKEGNTYRFPTKNDYYTETPMEFFIRRDSNLGSEPFYKKCDISSDEEFLNYLRKDGFEGNLLLQANQSNNKQLSLRPSAPSAPWR